MSLSLSTLYISFSLSISLSFVKLVAVLCYFSTFGSFAVLNFAAFRFCLVSYCLFSPCFCLLFPFFLSLAYSQLIGLLFFVLYTSGKTFSFYFFSIELISYMVGFLLLFRNLFVHVYLSDIVIINAYISYCAAFSLIQF